jgi:hypothetical protein
MKAALKAALLSTFALLMACEGQADENLEAAAEEAAGDLGNGLEAAAEDTENAVSDAGDMIANGVREVDNEVDVDVDLNADGNDSSANR